VICANCGSENRPGRRFCLKCGTALATGCANCGAENEAEAEFCGNCGQPLGSAAPVGVGARTPIAAQMANATAERRLVTVLFADLVGFTPFAEERDAEEVRDTLERYGAIAREVVTRYGGTVEKFIGDAVMAVWGTPTAHEDDAERAVRAALELTDAARSLGPEIQARAGVLTGEAAVNLAATDQALLAGDLVNTAARLQGVAPPGTVLVGESTMRATSASLAYEPAGDQTLKGKQSPVPAWQALRVIAQRRGAGRSESVETPFVGRDEEFRLLREQLHLAGRDPRTRLVSITGPAGIGKSRLAWELEKYIDGIVDTIYWHRGRCPSYGEGVSFWALGEMVRRRAGLAETDDEATTRQRIRQAVDEYVSEPGERDWINDALLVLLGVEQAAQAGRETLFAAWRRFFENIAARGATVLVFEDLHWADPGLLDFIDHLLDWSKQARLLVVTLARPELFDRRPDWGAGRRTFTALALDPLSEPHMREMLQALVPDLPAAALSAIVARADGIPLYAVETVRMLLADGRLVETDGGYQPTRELGDLEVPDSLRSLITSRLDGLDAADRRTIQDASVLGQTFTLEALADLTGEPPAALETRLRQLVRRELLTLQVDPRSPERGQFGFTQSLVREVAYSTLARPQRRERHLAVARRLEASGGEELAGALAGHYLAAYQASAAGPEADTVAAQARIALRGAAERAAALGGHRQAADFLLQAVAVTKTPADRAQLLERHAAEIDLAGNYDEAESSARAAIELYRHVSDAAGVGRTRGVLGTVLVHAGHPAAAVKELEAAVAELPDDTEASTRGDVLAKLSRAYYRNLQLSRSIEVADEALAIGEHHRLLGTLAEAMVSKGTALSMSARPIEALALLRGGMELARRVGDIATTLRAAANLGSVIAGEESSAGAMKLGYEALEMARMVGNFGQIVWHTGNLTMGAIFAGESLPAMLAMCDELLATDLSESDRKHLLGPYVIAASLCGRDTTEMMAELETAADPQTRGELGFFRYFGAIARNDYTAAAREAEQSGEARPHFGIVSVAALAAAMDSDLANLRRLLARAAEMPIAGRTDAANRIAARGAVAALEHRVNEALPDFREALREQSDVGDMLGYGTVALTMLSVLGAASPEARSAGEQALATFERMGATPMVEQLRAALAGMVPPTQTAAPAQPEPATVPTS
jgi:class 3 adenylate cyclase/predicted ATPase